MDFPNPLSYFLGAGTTTIHQGLTARILRVPKSQRPVSEKVFVIKPDLFQARSPLV
jgi:hypothetical protein